MNPGRFVIDTNKFSKVITIKNIKHYVKLNEYAAYTVVDSTVQRYLRKVFDIEIFAIMLTSDNYVLNNYTAL